MNTPGEKQLLDLSARFNVPVEAMASLLGALDEKKNARRRRRRPYGLLLALLPVLAIFSVRASADSPPLAWEVVPRQIPYQGYLELDGAAVSATVNMKFDIYASAAPTDTTSLWTETRAIQVVSGRFGVDLGDVNPVPVAVLQQQALYLGITLEPATSARVLTGRQRLSSVPYAQRSADGVPPGTLVAFAGDAAPSGWLLCDGTPLKSSNHNALFAAIGTNWGNGSSGVCTEGSCNFNLPDLRGRFLRGVSADSNQDPDASSRLAASTGGNTGNAVGSVQASATAIPNAGFTTSISGTHVHNNGAFDRLMATVGNTNPGEPYSWGGGGDSTPSEPNLAASRSMLANGNHTHNVTGGDHESRPANANVHWIIKN